MGQSRYGNNQVDFSTSTDTISRNIRTIALELICSYGYRKLAMLDVATALGISKAALYMRFSSKDALIRATSDWLIMDALALADAAWQTNTDLETNLAHFFRARDNRLHDIFHSTPHGSILLEGLGHGPSVKVLNIAHESSARLKPHLAVFDCRDFHRRFRGIDQFCDHLCLLITALFKSKLTLDSHLELTRELCGVYAEATSM